MDELLIKVRDQLAKCNLANETRLNLLNRNSPNECLVCFLLVSDKFKNLEELLEAITNCLSTMSVSLSAINNSRVIIHPM